MGTLRVKITVVDPKRAKFCVECSADNMDNVPGWS